MVTLPVVSQARQQPLTPTNSQVVVHWKSTSPGKLGNHNIPQLLAHFEENLEFYLVQEFIPGHLPECGTATRSLLE